MIDLGWPFNFVLLVPVLLIPATVGLTPLRPITL